MVAVITPIVVTMSTLVHIVVFIGSNYGSSSRSKSNNMSIICGGVGVLVCCYDCEVQLQVSDDICTYLCCG